ncbi:MULTISPECIES: LysR family transcriptional regulator substrate-binding protein [unclassified Pseudomonas]|uniref:LysR family transcriptional regulator substrate-binding protein n=1 Tax=unclassified Pseudomonas TaxID=196821 RepID=UPI00214FD748|nr:MULTISPECIES: LysR family transcriptional regulator substrate-binding protein [unclassified Pseudomonas]
MVMTVLEGSANDISQRLQNREIDVALLDTRRVETTWDSVLLGTDAMVLCMNGQHPLVGQPLLEAHQLRDEDMLVFDKTFLQRHLLDAYCGADGVKADASMDTCLRRISGLSSAPRN